MLRNQNHFETEQLALRKAFFFALHLSNDELKLIDFERQKSRTMRLVGKNAMMQSLLSQMLIKKAKIKMTRRKLPTGNQSRNNRFELANLLRLMKIIGVEGLSWKGRVNPLTNHKQFARNSSPSSTKWSKFKLLQLATWFRVCVKSFSFRSVRSKVFNEYHKMFIRAIKNRETHLLLLQNRTQLHKSYRTEFRRSRRIHKLWH